MPLNWDQLYKNDQQSMQDFTTRAQSTISKYLTPDRIANISQQNGGDERSTISDITNLLLQQSAGGASSKFRSWVTQLAPVLRIQQKLGALGGGGPVGQTSQSVDYKDFPSYLSQWLGQNPSGMASGPAAHDMFTRAMGQVQAYSNAQAANGNGTPNAFAGMSPDFQALMSTIEPSDLQAFLGYSMQAQSPYLFSKMGNQLASQFNAWDAINHGANGLGGWLQFYDQLRGSGFGG